jgi:RhoGEF domain
MRAERRAQRRLSAPTRPRQTQLSAQLEKRAQIIAEILKVEENYTANLLLVNTVFIEPLTALVGTEDEVLSALQLKRLFSSWPVIAKHHEVFLKV